VSNLDRVDRKFQQARAAMPPPVVERVDGARVGIVGYGTSHWGISESRDQLRLEAGLDTSYLRLRAYPFSAELQGFVEAHDRVYVVEQNRDGQMAALILLDIDPSLAPKIRRVRHYDGLPLDARTVTDAILAQERN
jgi:2-oxoglutarate ferredoxin oxidoreductase subunit alpha